MRLIGHFQIAGIGITIIGFLLSGCIVPNVRAQGLFDTDEALEITLKSDFKSFRKNKYKDEYKKAELLYIRPSGDSVVKEIKIKPRGNFRRKYCYYPPLKLNFKKVDFDNPEVDKIKKLKLVGACKGGKAYDQYVFKEYIAYKMFNLLTEYSFKVKLMQITYIDTHAKSKAKPMEEYGFVIEEHKKLAKRLNSMPLELMNVHPMNIDTVQANRIAVFAYMIGNTDWAISALHNIKLIKSKDPLATQPYAVPYDFDYSGFVNSSYAIPPEELPIENVRERLFRGFCYPESTFKSTFKEFIEVKSGFYALITEDPHLSPANKSDMTNYLDSFYEVIENPNRYKSDIIQACRKQ